MEATVLLGDDTLEVVGESHYQNILWSIVGGHTENHVHHRVYAALVPEPTNAYDSNAIAVWIDGQVVGYLSRDNAVRYKPGLLALYKKHQTPIALQGAIVGGGIRADGIGFLGVFLEHDPADFGLPSTSTQQAGSRDHVRTGRHESNPTVSSLDSLPSDDAAAIKQLRALLGTEQDLLTRHFFYAELEHRLYHCRDAFASALEEFDAACGAHDREMDVIRPALVAKFGGIPLLETYRQICIRKQKAYLWNESLAWTTRGLSLYGDDALDPEFVNDLRQREAHATEKLNPSERQPRPRSNSTHADHGSETLVCRKCSQEFTRVVTRGRKPSLCPACHEVESAS